MSLENLSLLPALGLLEIVALGASLPSGLALALNLRSGVLERLNGPFGFGPVPEEDVNEPVSDLLEESCVTLFSTKIGH